MGDKSAPGMGCNRFKGVFNLTEAIWVVNTTIRGSTTFNK